MLVNVNANDRMIGISAGFAIGLGVLYGLEYIITYFEEKYEVGNTADSAPGIAMSSVTLNPSSNWALSGLLDDGSVKGFSEDPQKKNVLVNRVNDLVDTVQKIYDDAKSLAQDTTISRAAAEEQAERIEEETCSLKYKIENCRRLGDSS